MLLPQKCCSRSNDPSIVLRDVFEPFGLKHTTFNVLGDGALFFVFCIFVHIWNNDLGHDKECQGVCLAVVFLHGVVLAKQIFPFRYWQSPTSYISSGVVCCRPTCSESWSFSTRSGTHPFSSLVYFSHAENFFSRYRYVFTSFSRYRYGGSGLNSGGSVALHVGAILWSVRFANANAVNDRPSQGKKRAGESASIFESLASMCVTSGQTLAEYSSARALSSNEVVVASGRRVVLALIASRVEK